MARLHKDKYSNFAELAKYERKNRDYRILLIDRHSRTTILAPHGGKIEPKTSSIAKAIAAQDFNLYCFKGIKRNCNYETLHITSHRFDERKCLQLLSKSNTVISIHGCDGNTKEVYVGGRNKRLAQLLALSLRHSGFVVKEREHKYRGEEKSNICNRGSTRKGVQLELTTRLRRDLAINRFASIVREAIL